MKDPIGKTLFAEYEKPLVVSGIVKDFPAYSSIRLKPVSILMKREILKQNPFGLRAVLNIIQNSVSISLIIALVVLSRQIEYVRTKDYGFDTDKLLRVDVHWRLAR